MSTILITGGTGAIGSAIAAEFAATDDVVFTYNSRADEAQRLCGELRCSAVRCDVADYASCEAAAEKVLKDYGRLAEHRMRRHAPIRSPASSRRAR